MKITFLGTSHGVPSAIRYCQSIMLEVGEAVYLIDGGAPVGDLLTRRGVAFERTKAVFFTHMHSDHCAGIHEFLALASWYYKTCSYDVYMPDEYYVNAFHALHVEMDRERVRLHAFPGEGEVYRDENITVTAVPTRHMEHSCAYVIDTADGKRLIVTGDLHGGDAADFPQIAKDEPSDAIICEQAHFPMETIFEHLRVCPTKQVWMTHVAYNYDVSIAKLREAEANHTLPMPMHAVDDGDVYEI